VAQFVSGCWIPWVCRRIPCGRRTAGPARRFP